MSERLETKVASDSGAPLEWCGEGVIGKVDKSEAIMGSTEIAYPSKFDAASPAPAAAADCWCARDEDDVGVRNIGQSCAACAWNTWLWGRHDA